MPLGERLLGFATVLLISVILAGLTWKHLYRLCYFFPSYLFAVALGDFLMLTWPKRFYQWEFWQAKETLYALLKFGIALELAALTLQAFPGARARARLWALGMLSLTLLVLALNPAPGEDLADLAVELQPRLANGTALLFAVVWGAVIWYHIPLHRLHRAILRGFVPFLLTFTVLYRLLTTVGWDVHQAVNYGTGAAYVLMLLYWTWEVWRHEPISDVDPQLLRRLQPWRDRL